MSLCVFDIESDNLLTDATTIWCIVAKVDGAYAIYHHPSVTNLAFPQKTYITNDIDHYIKYVLYQPKHTLVGHGIINFDLPLLKKLHGYSYSIDPATLVDTHILSRLYNPDRPEHSLAYFGDLLKYPKGDHSDWSQFSQEMLDYCIRDVDLTEAVYSYLLKEGAGWDWSEAIKLEYNIWDIQQRQEQHGVLFDQKAAEKLLEKIQTEIDELESTIIKEIPPTYKNDGEVKKVFLKNGDYTQSVKTWLGE